MSTIRLLADDNARYLNQALLLLESLSDSLFAEAPPMGLGSAVGAHLRHCLDHYENFLAGLSAGKIDYDARQRDRTVETSRAAAKQKLIALIEQLQEVGGREDQGVDVKMDCGNNATETEWWTRSSIRRELQFLISHTVHHYAIIKMALKASGFECGPDFGMAPSTLRYHQGLSACAH